MPAVTAKILVSACLLGRRVRYDAGHSAADRPLLDQWQAAGLLVPFCPEVAGGLGTPRPPAEIVGGSAEDVLDGRARVVTREGAEVTDAFIAGAYGALETSRAHGAMMAILKSKSPSCGSKQVYDGSFGGRLVAGCGVTTALLERHGLAVFNEHQLEEAQAHLRDCSAERRS